MCGGFGREILTGSHREHARGWERELFAMQKGWREERDEKGKLKYKKDTLPISHVVSKMLYEFGFGRQYVLKEGALTTTIDTLVLFSKRTDAETLLALGVLARTTGGEALLLALYVDQDHRASAGTHDLWCPKLVYVLAQYLHDKKLHCRLPVRLQPAAATLPFFSPLPFFLTGVAFLSAPPRSYMPASTRSLRPPETRRPTG